MQDNPTGGALDVLDEADALLVKLRDARNDQRINDEFDATSEGAITHRARTALAMVRGHANFLTAFAMIARDETGGDLGGQLSALIDTVADALSDVYGELGHTMDAHREARQFDAGCHAYHAAKDDAA